MISLRLGLRRREAEREPWKAWVLGRDAESDGFSSSGYGRWAQSLPTS